MPSHPRFDPSDDLLDARPAATLDLRGLVKGLLQGELREFVADWSRDDAEGGYKVRVRP